MALEAFTGVHRWRVLALLIATAAAGCNVPVQVTVLVPPSSQARDDVVLWTDEPALGQRIALDRISDTVWVTTLALEEGQSVTLRARKLDGRYGLGWDWTPVEAHVKAQADGKARAVLDVARWDIEIPEGSARVRLLVTAPPLTPEDAQVWVRGWTPELGGGRPDGVRMARLPDGRFGVEVALPIGLPVEYRYTLGSEFHMEVDPTGSKLAVRTLTPRDMRVNLVEDVVSRWQGQTLTGDLRVHELIWDRTGARRRIVVYLPPGYADSADTRYPVLYLHQGERLFDALTTPDEWCVDETAERLIREGRIEPLIIVGVYGAGPFAEVNDFTYLQLNGYSNTGGAEYYRQFLVQGVKPFIDEHYRTRPDARDTGLAGATFGGLVTMWLGLVEPATFRRLGVISGATWFADEDIVQRVSRLPRKLPLRVWVDVGEDELYSESQRQTFHLRYATAAEYARDLRDALIARGWVLGEDLHYLEMPDAVGDDLAFRARFGQVLEWLYPPPVQAPVR